ncbi:hypothetical protein [Streptomyces sp. NPDC058374]|uniref:hypothetical protein n=1 Tax=unclassified Streptomyces TaxID=2593676 RepID=UPI003652B2A4
MNRRPIPLAVTALAVAAGLSLSACGGEGSDGGGDKPIAGAGQEGGEESGSPTASPKADPDRPKIELPADLTMTFEGGETGDAVKDAVLADSAERMRGVNAVIAGTAPESVLGHYNTGKALEAAASWVAQFEKAEATVTGEVRYYDRKVALDGKKAATLSFCADESKGFSKDAKTDKVSKTPVSKNSYVFYNTRLDLNGAGTWQTSQIVSTRGSKQCQP